LSTVLSLGRWHQRVWAPFVLVIMFVLLPAVPVDAAPIVIDVFPIPTPNAQPVWLTLGPDGNIWFTDLYGIGQITPEGVITEFPYPQGMCTSAQGITSGPDGNLWFAEICFPGHIARSTPGGVITEFPIPTDLSGPEGITAGPDGNVWFTEYFGNNIGRITPAGSITEFPLPVNSNPKGITLGSDGNLWFTEQGRSAIGRITPAGVITEFALAGSPIGITSGRDGNLWFTEDGGVGTITTQGVVMEFPAPNPALYGYAITPGPGDYVWFTDYNGGKVFRVTPDGVISKVASRQTSTWGITLGPGGTSVWFAEPFTNDVARVTLGP
jgi:streptogramin lyase